MKKTMPKATSLKKLDQYIGDAQKKLKKGEVPTISNKTNLTTEDKLKLSLCKLFVQFLNRKSMRPSELSKLTQIEKTRISEIINYKVTKFKLGQLLKHLEVLSEHSPEVRQHLLYLEQAFELPVLKVPQSKKIVTSIKKMDRPAYTMAN